MTGGWKIAWCLCAGGAFALLGCAQRSRPFQDVVQRQAGRSSMLEQSPQAPLATTRPAPSEAIVSAPQSPAVPTALATRPTTPATTRDAAGGPVAVLEQTHHPIQPGAEGQPIPMLIHDKVARRDWPASICYRPSGDVIAGPTYWPRTENYRPRGEYINLFMDPGEFLFNSIFIPVRLVLTPPWVEVNHSAVGPAGKEHVDFGQPNMGPPPPPGEPVK